MSTTEMASPVAETFRRRVKFIMQERGISITALAAEINTSRPSMSRILTGDENVSLDRADRIAAALGVQLSELLSEKLTVVANSA